MKLYLTLHSFFQLFFYTTKNVLLLYNIARFLISNLYLYRIKKKKIRSTKESSLKNILHIPILNQYRRSRSPCQLFLLCAVLCCSYTIVPTFIPTFTAKKLLLTLVFAAVYYILTPRQKESPRARLARFAYYTIIRNNPQKGLRARAHARENRAYLQHIRPGTRGSFLFSFDSSVQKKNSDKVLKKICSENLFVGRGFLKSLQRICYLKKDRSYLSSIYEAFLFAIIFEKKKY